MRDANIACAAGLEHGLHARNFVDHFFRRAIRLAEQNRHGIDVVAGFDEGFDRPHCRLIHHLQTGWNDAGRNHRRHRISGQAHIIEAGQNALRGLCFRQQLDGNFRRHAEHAFRADEQRE